jgi:secreted trypsin-like serine protease
LIRPQWIITAAHCVKGLGENPANFWFSVGSNDYRLGTFMEAAEFLPHPEFGSGSTQFADIALVRLKTPASESPVSVSPPPDDRGSAVRTIGWGRTIDGDGASIPDVVRQLDTQLRPLQDCYFVNDPFAATPGDLCVRRAKDNTAGACNGDSGSPLLYRAGGRWHVVGVDSRSGGETGCLNTDEVYVSIWYHWTWVKRTLDRYPA